MINPADRPAAEVCADLVLDDEARGLLQDDASARDFLDLLMENELYTDAIKVLARLLAKRAAVEWACAALRDGADDGEASDPEGLVAAEKWVSDPCEANRRASLAAAEAANYSTPAGLVAAAAGWSGGSLTSPDLPPVPPGEHLTSQAVSGVLILVAAREPEAIDARQNELLERGLRLLGED